MSVNLIETLPPNISAPTVEQVAADMIALNWSDYNQDPFASINLGLHKRKRLAELLPSIDVAYPVTKINGIFLPIVSKEEAIDAYDMPEKVRLEVLEGDVQDCKILAQLLDEGPFGACNKKVSAAVRASICDAADTLLDAYVLQKPATETKDIFDVPAGLSIKLLRHTLVSTAVKLGAIDSVEGMADFETEVFPSSTMTTEKLRNGGTSNTYLTKCLDILEWPDSDYVDPESPTYLAISAIPGSRVSFETDFVSAILAARFKSKHTKKGQLTASTNFSLRIDYDDKSPNGFSLDLGRDARDSVSYQRSGDPAGKSLQQLRPEEGSHFTEHFDGITAEDMEEFIRGINTLLEADASMKRYHEHIRNRSGLNNPARLGRVAIGR